MPIAVCAALCGSLLFGVTTANAQSEQAGPVYVHMNGKNDFLESVVAVRPGQAVVFVNQDTGEHAVQGYDPIDGKLVKTFSDRLGGSKGEGHAYATYKITFSDEGFHFYYCPIHAELQNVFKQEVQPAHRKGVPGYAGAMAGVIVVTVDKALLDSNPKSSHEETLSGFWGG